MAFREVTVVEIREVLRLWLRGRGLRSITKFTGVDRKTVRRYVEAAAAAGLVRGSDDAEISDALIGAVCDAVRPVRPHDHGEAWEAVAVHRQLIQEWLDDDGLTLVKVNRLLERRGVVVPYRTLHRFAAAELGFGRKKPTVRVADGEPGKELQVDYGRMGLIPDAHRRRVCRALIFTACFSRHMFVWLTFRETLEATIEGFERAWEFFGGVFAVIIPDNLAAIVTHADPVAPVFNPGFWEYAQDRGFLIDPARVGRPKDKPRVERTVPFVRNSFFAGEQFTELDDGRRRAVSWCLNEAGLRIHGTTRARPLEVFRADEAPLLLPLATTPYDLPIYADPKVHRDHHIAVAKALYSVPGNLIGETVQARADTHLVKVRFRGHLIKEHPRQPPGSRSTDPADLPPRHAPYATRDIDYLQRQAAEHGDAVGSYAAALLDNPLPWTKMRQVYRLLGLVKRYGSERVNAACQQALDLEVVDIGLIGRMLERALEHARAVEPAADPAVSARFARDAAEFTVGVQLLIPVAARAPVQEPNGSPNGTVAAEKRP